MRSRNKSLGNENFPFVSAGLLERNKVSGHEMYSTPTIGWNILHDGMKVRFDMTRRDDQNPFWLQWFPERCGSGHGQNVTVMGPTA